jgi:PAS domain S-box-containing protein
LRRFSLRQWFFGLILRRNNGDAMAIPVNVACEDLLQSIADGVFTVDLDFNVLSFNEAAVRISGVPREEAVGAKCWEVLHSDLCDGACALRESMRSGQQVVNKSCFFVRPDGERVPVSISAAALRDSGGRITGGVESFRDLTDIHIMRRRVQETYSFQDIVGKGQALARIFQIMPQVSQSEATVLVLGESGTGKELFARAIHSLSRRKAGAFTDARKDKPGRFELARGGTIFLDEIGDLPGKLQVKLLRVLQEKSYEPLGGVDSVAADVRVIAATNRNLEDLVAEGAFRQDLYYRLNVVTLRLPALRERREDLPLLISHFITRMNAEQGKALEGVSEDVLALFMRHDFPGNVRELENILEFAFILCPSGFIQMEHMPDSMQAAGLRRAEEPQFSGTLEEIKCKAVLQALERNNGRKMATCRELDISKDTLRRMLGRCSLSGE